jgi:hypothetical protein
MLKKNNKLYIKNRTKCIKINVFVILVQDKYGTLHSIFYCKFDLFTL